MLSGHTYLGRYDPLALLAALPSYRHYFEFEELTVGRTAHRVAGR